MSNTFDLFIRHRRYVDNYSENTISTFKVAWKKWTHFFGEEVSKPLATEFVARMMESGVTPQSANVHIKAMNGYFLWLHEHEYILEPIHLKSVKAVQKVVQPIPDETIRRIVAWKPKKATEHRLYALMILLIDTGIRIDEGLTLRRDCVDFDNLLIKVRGKGNKERIVPFSLECRKVLYRFMQRHEFSLVFATSTGNKYTYKNCWRDLQTQLDKLGVSHAGWHQFRHGP